jgi:DNA-binding response OmpR family regulator
MAARDGTRAASRAGPSGEMRMILEREVVVLSNDGRIRSEVSAAVARRPGARAIFAEPNGFSDTDPGPAGRIVVIDDEGQEDAVALIHRLRSRGREPSVVYLAARHSTTLEGEVRRAGATFYAEKAARDGSLARVIEALLGHWET